MNLLAERHDLRTTRGVRRTRRRLRRALKAQDRLGATLAELRRVDEVLARSMEVVEHGWVQGAWYTYVTPAGAHASVSLYTRRDARRPPEEVTGTCLVGAIVQAAGGPAQAHGQLVQRALEVTWHAQFRGAPDRVRWRPSPDTHAGHVGDLVRWNDGTCRAAEEAVGLLGRARDVVRAELEGTRTQQQATARELAALADAAAPAR